MSNLNVSKISTNAIRIVTSIKETDSKVIVYHNDEIGNLLLKNEYLVIGGSEKADFIDHYDCCTKTNKLLNTSVDDIFKDIFKISISEFKELKKIPREKIPSDYEDLFYTLLESDGYFTGVSFDDDFKGILELHGFVKSCGVNGSHAYGTDKLNDYCKMNKEEEIINLVSC